MVRIRRGKVAIKRRKQVLKFTRGFRGAHSKLFRTANQQFMKGLKYSYTGRKQRKRLFRKLWIIRINATVRKYGLNYNQFISALKKTKISLNRKILAQLAINDLPTFTKLISYGQNA
jgi:large subunit ribosomal protein L20